MDSSERGMNPVTMTIINLRKEYWPSRGSNQRPPVLKSATLLTELWGLAQSKCSPVQVNSLPNDKIVDQSYLKAVVDGKINPVPDDKMLDWSK